MLKAIETRYKGYRFRSRLEARWAVFLDTLDIPFEYESEGYNLDGLQYLPDFWLPDQKLWLEIKGQAPTAKEQEKARRLSKMPSKGVAMFIGTPAPIPPTGMPSAPWAFRLWVGGQGPTMGAPLECEACREFGFSGLTTDGRLMMSFGCTHKDKYKITPRLNFALSAARSARFEFGESGR